MDLLDTDWQKHPKAGEYAPIIGEAESRYRLPAGMLGSLIHRESRFDPNARSHAGATGIAQLMPVHWRAVGDPKDPMRAIPYAGKELDRLHRRFGSWDKALAAYNWGEGNLSNLLRKSKKAGTDWTTQLPKETSAYIAALTPKKVTYADDDMGEAYGAGSDESYEETQLRAEKQEKEEQAAMRQQAAEYQIMAADQERQDLEDENKAQFVTDLKDRAGDILLRAPAKAAVDLVNETFIAAKDLANWVLPIEGLVRGEAAAAASRASLNEGMRDGADALVKDPTTGFGSFERDLLQFVGGYATAAGYVTKARSVAGLVGSGGKIADPALIGFIVDSGLFDPDSPGLSNFVQSFPSLANPVTEFLASDPDDPETLNRFRKGLEGTVVGIVVDPLMLIFKAARASHVAKRRAKVEADADALGREFTADDALAPEPAKADTPVEAQAKADPEAAPKTPEQLLDDVEAQRIEAERHGDTAQSEKLADEAQRLETERVGDPELAKKALEERRIKRALNLDPETKAALADALLKGDLSTARGLLNFNGNYVDFTKIEHGGDIRKMMNTVSDLLSQEFKDVERAAPISHAQTAEAAKALNMTQKEVARVFQDSKGMDHRILAADQVMHASGARLKRLADVANKLNPKTLEGTKARAEFLKQVELHAAIMAEVRGAKREVARALNAMKILKQPDEVLWKDFDSMLKQQGGKGLQDPTELMIRRIIGARTSKHAHIMVREFTRRTMKDAMIEVAINGLLSSPKTHLVNLTSNSLMVAFGALDRTLAATLISPVQRAYGKAMGRKIEAYEGRAAVAYLRGTWHGMFEGARAAIQALRTRAPVTDMAQKIEFTNRRAIHMEVDGKTGLGKGVAQGINALGEIIRIPGTLLVAGDELFKGIARRASLEEHSYLMAAKQADELKLVGDARLKHINKAQADIKADPSIELQVQITQDSRYATFQEAPTTKGGAAMEKAMNASPIVKLIVAPFFRTPMNILRQTFVDRTPLALFNESLRKQLTSGGPEAAVAMSRITLGTTALSFGSMLAQKGLVTGKDKYSNTESLDNEPEYSLHVFGKAISINRLDPIGGWLGMAADYHKHMVENYDPHAPDPDMEDRLAQVGFAFLSAISKNALSKTWMESFQQIVDAVSKDQSDDEAAKKWTKLLAGNAGKLMPYSSLQKAITQTGDPVVHDAWSFSERMFRNAPLTYNTPDGVESVRETPAMRDYLGRPVLRHNAEWYWINPFAIAPESTDPLEVELSRMAFQVQPTPRKMDGVQLSTEQYSEYKRLIGQESDEFFGGRNLEQFLRELVQSDDYAALSESEGDFEGSKEAQIGAYYSAAKAIAKGKLLAKYPELDTAIYQRKLLKAETLSPGSTEGM